MNTCMQALLQPPQIRPYGSPQIAAHAAQVWIARMRDAGLTPQEIKELWLAKQDNTPRVDLVWKLAQQIDARVTS